MLFIIWRLLAIIINYCLLILFVVDMEQKRDKVFNGWTYLLKVIDEKSVNLILRLKKKLQLLLQSFWSYQNERVKFIFQEFKSWYWFNIDSQMSLIFSPWYGYDN